ncbi:neural proliferation differentiation and control protein 1a [Dunckerocampus dactyliophorus]|uniref:neural proliferation differentiation and control protein 1a n=1 Tax=Dunckerocampus dactyliophorus TaxID=161453 RepID=UPI0024071F29|nr:neural proliferation differentiation and control protein 1a [Dunckerocampus dactyliophorus]
MPPLSSPRSERHRRASALLLAVVMLCVVRSSASFSAGRKCPRLDCAKEGRNLCPPGLTVCGSCLTPLVENEMGRCVIRKRYHQHAKTAFYPDPDEEIDFIHSYIEKQEVSAFEAPKTQLKPPVVYSNGGSKIDASEQEGQSSQDGSPAASRNGTAAGSGRAGVSNLSTPQPGATGVQDRAGPRIEAAHGDDRIVIIIISLFVAVGTVALLLATVCYIKLQKESRLAQKVDYPAFRGAGVTAATDAGKSMGDKTLAQSAQMYHYQHQKQQMLSMNNKAQQKVIDAEVTSDEEEAGDFTVYECPGLAPTGEMEVKNPLFDDSTLHYQGHPK